MKKQKFLKGISILLTICVLFSTLTVGVSASQPEGSEVALGSSGQGSKSNGEVDSDEGSTYSNTAVDDLLGDILASVPVGQQHIAYNQNYQSNQPEELTFLKGNGSSTVNNGLNIQFESLENSMALVTWDKAGWMSAGTIDVTFKYNSTPASNIGFVFGALNGSDSGLVLRYDSATTWVLQSAENGVPYKTYTGLKLDINTEYHAEFGYFGDKIVLVIDDVEIINTTIPTDLKDAVSPIGKIGMAKRFALGSVDISSLTIDGVGTLEKPSEYQRYFNDYEDVGYTPSWSNLNAKVIADSTGNKVLEVKRISGEYGGDLDTPSIKNGTMSFDFKLATMSNGFAFSFRNNSTSSLFSALGIDPNRWIPESSIHWGDTLDIPYPVEGQWNNLLVNFQDKVITVYLNKEFAGEYTFDKFTDNAGHFGLRVRGGGVVHLDNLLYTDEIIVPEEPIQYENDFNDGVVGNWINTVPQTSIITEGSNKYLKLSQMAGTTWNNDSVAIDSGSLLMDIKPVDSDIGVLFADGNSIKFDGNNWIVKTKHGTEVTLVPTGGVVPAPKPFTWNKFEMNFYQSSLKVCFNGVEMEASLPVGETFGEGKFGVYSASDIYIDNLLYTELTLDIGSSYTSEKFYLEEYYESASLINWTGLSGSAVSGGMLEGSIAANGEAINNDIPAMSNGVFQLKIESDTTKLGLRIGTVEINHDSGVWSYKEGAQSAENFAGSLDLEDNKPFIIRARVLNQNLSLSINNQAIGEVELTTAPTLSDFAIVNNSATPAQIKIDALGVEELRIYASDYSTLNWSAIAGTPTFVSSGTAVVANMPGVALAVDNDSYSMKNQELTFDWSTNVGVDMSGGGRYGVLLRADDNAELSITHDINGIWSIDIKGSTTKFPVTYSLLANEVYEMRIKIVDQNISFWITDSTNVETLIGSINNSSIPTGEGKFGVRGWYGSKKITIDNLKMVEQDSLPLFYQDAVTDTITNGSLTVKLDTQFPRIEEYSLNGKTIKGEEAQVATVNINGQEYQPMVEGIKTSADSFSYNLKFPSIQVEMDAIVKVIQNDVMRFEITDIKETGTTKVRSIAISGKLFYTDTLTSGSSYAAMASSGAWHGITESLIDDLKDVIKSENRGATIVAFSSNGLSGSIENNTLSGGNKFGVITEKKPLSASVSMYSNQWTYRHALSDNTEELPWYEVVIAEDENSDSIVDWQDGAVAYRDSIYRAPFGAEDMRNNMMYIAFNFASQANDPFLNTLDTGKVLYNYTDGFGQMILHKGYQGEGHDDDIPSYSNVGIRQGGMEEFKYLISEGDKYNLSIGVHINATEYHIDANELDYQNLTGATTGGPKVDSLAGGWDWIDTSYYVDQTKDLLSGQLEKRFSDLYNNSKNSDGTAIDFYYIDVYTGNDYNGYKMVQTINDLGVKAGTEFAGPMEPGVTFVHWGPDLGYPNQGNGSILARMIKNDTDIFIGNEMFKGQKIPGVTTWGESKPDVQQGITVFFNEVLPTKFMQHHNVMKYEEDKLTFSENVASTRANGRIELSQDDKVVAYWKDTSIGASNTERHTSETTLLMPWTWDIKTNATLGLNDGAKLYHWNPTGGASTWQLTNMFKAVPQFDLYELTQHGRKFVETVSNSGGSVTLNTTKNTPYVLYPSTSTAKNDPAAGNWGEGSIVKDFAFNSEKLNQTGGWKTSDTASVSIKVTAGRTGYPINNPSAATWNRYAEIAQAGGSLTQDVSGLIAGEDYTLSVWTKTDVGRKSSLSIELGGETLTNYVTGIDENHTSSFKYRGTTWQRNYIKFKVPVGVTTGKITLSAEAGATQVMFDDVRISKHETNVANPGGEGYVVYEDFENTYAGWGPFEYQSGSLRVHITSDRSNAYDDNQVVSAADKTVGPVMTWVLDGEQSLKLGENEVGRAIKTNETAVKLSANTDYKLGFIYTQEPGVTYKLIIKSRSSATPIYEETLDASANSWKKTSSKAYTKEFNTGNKEDVQIIFQLVTANSALRSNATTFILDNFYIKEAVVMVASTSPAMNEENVAKDGTIQLTFKNAMDIATVGTVALSNGGVTTGGTWSSGNTVYTVNYANLNYNTTYNVTVNDFKNMSNELMEEYTTSFKTLPQPDTIKPTVTSLTPSGVNTDIAGNIVINFSEPINIATGSVSLDKGIGALSGIWSNGNKIYTAAFTGFNYSTKYTVTVKDFADVSGNVMVAHTGDFTTKTKPIIPEVLPSQISIEKGKTADISVSLGTNGVTSASITVDKPSVVAINKASITTDGTIRITGLSAGTATVTVTFAGGSVAPKTVAITVTEKIEEGKYGLTVVNGTGGGSYKAGAIVSIKADTASAGKEFADWTVTGGGTIKDAKSSSTTFTMPANAVTVTATYKDKTIIPPVKPPTNSGSASSGGSSGGGGSKQDTAINPGITTGTTTSGTGGYKPGETVVGSASAIGNKPAVVVVSAAPAVKASAVNKENPYTKERLTKDIEVAVKQKGGAKAVIIRGLNYSGIDKAVLDYAYQLAQEKGIELQFRLDEMSGDKVVKRVYLTPSKNNTTVSFQLDASKILQIANLFKKHFKNTTLVIDNGNMAANIEVAVKLNAKISIENVVVYNYNPTNNTFTRAKNANAWLDKNGYLHFTAGQGAVVISDGVLVEK